MKYRLLALTAAAIALLMLAACGDDDDSTATPAATVTAGATPSPAAPFFDCAAQHPVGTPDATLYPVTVTDGAGTSVTVEKAPTNILSMDAADTEILYAIGAGGQVKAVDMTSNCPEAVNALSARIDAFTPSIEAITGLAPDLVVTAFDTGDIVAAMRSAGLTVLMLPSPADINGTYDTIELLGKATGHVDSADALVTSMNQEVQAIKADVAGQTGPSVYHELDNTYFTVGPGSFIDDLYKTLAAKNIAESTGQAYPQLSAEAIIAGNPDVIILADEAAGESATTVAARPGWSAIAAVKTNHVYPIDPDIVSRAGPRIIDALRELKEDLYAKE